MKDTQIVAAAGLSTNVGRMCPVKFGKSLAVSDFWPRARADLICFAPIPSGARELILGITLELRPYVSHDQLQRCGWEHRLEKVQRGQRA
jgi:hypothetical protein